MFKYNLQEVDYELSNELKNKSHSLPSKPPKFNSKKLIRCFTNKADILSIKLLDIALILPLIPLRVAQKMQFCEFANKAGR